MKKIFITVLVMTLITKTGSSQGVTQSAEGTSTVVLEGSAISLDPGKTDLTFGWNNLNNTIVTKNSGLLIGTNIKVKNAEGIGNLFSKGELVPQGSGTFYIGGYCSNALNKMDDAYKSERKELLDIAVKLFKDSLDSEINDIALGFINDLTKRNAAVDAVKKEYKNTSDDEKLFFAIRFSPNDLDTETRLFRTKLKERMIELKKNVEIPYRKVSKERSLQLAKINLSRKGYYKFTYYIFGGIDALDFKRFKGIDSSNLQNSFEDVYFRGGHFGVGVNIEYWRFRIGLTYSYVSTHNFSSLTATEYTLQTSTTISGQTLQSKDVVTAYSGGKYDGDLEKNDFNLDIIYSCKLDKKGENHILINPYIRASLFSRDTSLLIDKTNVGVGGYFFKDSGKFLGGLYIELPDVNNNIEKKKPVDKQNLRPPLKRLSFGINVKFSLKAIFGW
jgi:hypothetical protein